MTSRQKQLAKQRKQDILTPRRMIELSELCIYQREFDEELESVIENLTGMYNDSLKGESEDFKKGYRNGIAEGISLVVRRFGKFSSDKRRQKKAKELQEKLWGKNHNAVKDCDKNKYSCSLHRR